jgi:hypothetical protein
VELSLAEPRWKLASFISLMCAEALKQDIEPLDRVLGAGRAKGRLSA